MNEMNIKEATNAFKIADVISYDDVKDKLKFDYLNLIYDENKEMIPNKILTQKVPRVYLIVVNKKIYKIGQSTSKGGMKSTLQFYKDGGVKGSPSVRSYGVFHLMKNEFLKGSKIEFYMIYQNKIKANVKGLFQIHKNVDVSIHPKFIEEYCLLDFKVITNKIPVWNFQEKGEDWPEIIQKIHAGLKLAAAERKGRNK